ncbi:STAS/SEC14 domain-containing protein [Aurantiacibacter sediminis]|uniref:STAS/SEC14 domain-containing protein n=1 Tax=Aurantiacibacter sediminis TaxID=2793064 RepID=A0ABS0N1L4_9SPHN|nr:STAS/SEC14 domain-containing protein [Aurantiacibacter sediminis]MBH5321846.1 STAS/SEC14 domain-containing protein [Aurantiacibacter sediminis]
MANLDPTYRIDIDDEHGEIHFAVAGYWDRDRMLGFLKELDANATPILMSRNRLRALGDMSELTAQNREVGELISKHLQGAQRAGLERIAIVTDSATVRMQYRRLSEGLDVAFFSSQAEALAWLRDGT